MAIILDPVEIEWSDSGTSFSAVPREQRVQTWIRVGTRTPGAQLGPLGAGGRWTRWSADPRFRLSSHARNAYYQQVGVWLYPHARIRHHDVDISVHQATDEHLRILDDTLALVPPPHLEAVAREKPVGLGLTSFVGPLGNPNFTGGLNAGVDLPYTPYDDRRAILVTYASMWSSVSLGISLTVFHEFGHVMTRYGLSISRVDPELWEQIRTIRVSTNPGEMEALCNAYMFMLAAGSDNRRIRSQGRNEGNVLASARMRRAILASRAFRDLDEEWRGKYA